MNNYAMDTAARFGEIPFVEFTQDLVTGVFDSLVDAHLVQMEEYANFVNSLTQDLSTYINNTQDGVTFDQISDFVSNYDLPELELEELTDTLDNLKEPSTDDKPPSSSDPDATTPVSDANVKWWQGLIQTVAPAVENLVDKIRDPNEIEKYKTLRDYNQAVLDGVADLSSKYPTYKELRDAIAALIVSNKYGLLQTMAKQGAMRLVVTEGEIETKITFSTWNNSVSGSQSGYKKKVRHKEKAKDVKALNVGLLFRNKRKRVNKRRTVTVNTAKSYQRDSSGTKVDIFGRVLIRFKTDYAPLNG